MHWRVCIFVLSLLVTSTAFADEPARRRSGSWEKIDTLARAVPGYALVSVSIAADAPVTHLSLTVRPIQGGTLGTTVELGQHTKKQQALSAPAGYVITGVGAGAQTPITGIALEAAPLPPGVKLGDPVRLGDWSRQDVYEEVPEGFYIIGVGGAIAGGELTHLGIRASRLVHDKPDVVRPEHRDFLTIYVSEQGDDANDGSLQRPVKSIHRAATIAHDSDAPGFRILLRGGETFTPTQFMTGDTIQRRSPDRARFALVWDIDKPLVLSTYGSTELATIGPGGYTRDPDGVQGAICVTGPCHQNVLIENIHFRRWQMEVLFTWLYLPPEGTALTFRDNLVTEQGTLYFPDETTTMPGHRGQLIPFYTGGTLQLRTSRGFVVEDNIFRDVHNHIFGNDDRSLVDSMHVFYIGSTADVVIRGNVVTNTSGSPFKVRYQRTRNVQLLDNAFYYSGPSIQFGVVQEGWVRISGGRDGTDDWPSDVLIKGNYFFHPYCWSDREDCATAVARRFSVSKAYHDASGVHWEDNVIVYEWR